MTDRWAAMANEVRSATQTEATAKRMSSRGLRVIVGGGVLRAGSLSLSRSTVVSNIGSRTVV
jgi:hypothetical protein